MMKILASAAILIIAASKVFAQEPADALRYSWLTQGGTARNQAIGGAGGSLGGEFSTMFLNPAGIGFFKTNEFVFTPYLNIQKNKGVYRETSETAKKTDFGIGTTGFLISTPNYRNGAVKNFTIGLGINRMADFSSRVSFNGPNSRSSYSEKYLEELIRNNVTSPDSAAFLFPFGSSLALNTYVIDTLQAADGSIAGYKSLASVATGLNQRGTVITSGGVTDIALAGAVNLREKVFLGASLSVPVINYDRRSTFNESDATANAANNFNYFEVIETLKTQGFGINGKLGVIYKPVEYVRLGLAFHSPTLYELTDKYTAEVTSDLEGYGGGDRIKKQSSGLFTNDAPGQLKYSLTTPWKLVASASYVFREVENVKKQRAFVTADVEYVDYQAAGFKVIDKEDTGTKNYFSQLNSAINEQYKGAFNVRLGGELKFNTFMFRLGGAYYGNPYKNEKTSRAKLSGGLGYRDKGIFVDLTYVYSINKDVYYPYQLRDNTYDAAFIKNNAGNIILTVGFKI